MERLFPDPSRPLRGRLLTLAEPCPSCGRLGQIDAWLTSTNEVAGVHVDPECLIKRKWTKRHYGPMLGLDESNVKPRAKDDAGLRKRIHARCNYACVYCEADVDAKRFRLAQLQSKGLRDSTALAGLTSNVGSAEWDALVESLGDEPQNLFGLTVDHLIGVHERSRLNLTARQLANADKLWLVSAHSACNSDQYIVGRTLSERILVYLRFVHPYMPKSDRDSLFFDYVSIVRDLMRTSKGRSEGVGSAS